MKNFILTKEERDELREHLSNLLANGFADVCGFIDVDYNENAYEMARYELYVINKHKDVACHEDIQAQMLLTNGYLILTDEEGEKHHLTLKKILKVTECSENFQGWEKLENEGDFYDNNAILQEAIYGEVIYG